MLWLYGHRCRSCSISSYTLQFRSSLRERAEQVKFLDSIMCVKILMNAFVKLIVSEMQHSKVVNKNVLFLLTPVFFLFASKAVLIEKSGNSCFLKYFLSHPCIHALAYVYFSIFCNKSNSKQLLELFGSLSPYESSNDVFIPCFLSAYNQMCLFWIESYLLFYSFLVDRILENNYRCNFSSAF